MKYKTIKIIVLLVGIALTAFGFSDSPPNDPSFLTITRVTTSETRTLDFLPTTDGGWDLGDTDSTITENYGGNPFAFGKPMQIEVYISAPPAGEEWTTMKLQYVSGVDSGANTWTTIAEINTGFEDIEEVKGCHFGLTWTPPATGNYLVRIYGVTTSGLRNGSLTAPNITAKGDGATWDNHEVVGFTVTSNTRPG